jgi:hypothetical protein
VLSYRSARSAVRELKDASFRLLNKRFTVIPAVKSDILKLFIYKVGLWVTVQYCSLYRVAQKERMFLKWVVNRTHRFEMRSKKNACFLNGQ